MTDEPLSCEERDRHAKVGLCPGDCPRNESNSSNMMDLMKQMTESHRDDEKERNGSDNLSETGGKRADKSCIHFIIVEEFSASAFFHCSLMSDVFSLLLVSSLVYEYGDQVYGKLNSNARGIGYRYSCTTAAGSESPYRTESPCSRVRV